jgi:hypothetical protein
MENYTQTCPMAPTKTRNFVPRPHEASLAEGKGAPDRIGSNLDIEWRHALIYGDLR